MPSVCNWSAVVKRLVDFLRHVRPSPLSCIVACTTYKRASGTFWLCNYIFRSRFASEVVDEHCDLLSASTRCSSSISRSCEWKTATSFPWFSSATRPTSKASARYRITDIHMRARTHARTMRVHSTCNTVANSLFFSITFYTKLFFLTRQLRLTENIQLSVYMVIYSNFLNHFLHSTDH